MIFFVWVGAISLALNAALIWLLLTPRCIAWFHPDAFVVRRYEAIQINNKQLNDLDIDHLEWIYSRMLNMDQHHPNADYIMLKFKQIIDNLKRK